MKMKINELAKLTKVTIRTLHYYDQIGLLKPSETTVSGYRMYDEKALETLQQILFFRELDFSLNDIKQIMTSSNFDKTEALKKHKELLLKKRSRLDGLIDLVDGTLNGGYDMSFEQFDMTEIEEHKKKYAKEVKERYGTTDAYAECEQKTSNYDKNKWKMIKEDGSEIFKAFAMHIGEDPGSEGVQALVKQWQDYITDNFYTCTKEILSGLGSMYVADERFKENIDKSGVGTAEFLSKAIEIYCR